MPRWIHFGNSRDVGSGALLWKTPSKLYPQAGAPAGIAVRAPLIGHHDHGRRNTAVRPMTEVSKRSA